MRSVYRFLLIGALHKQRGDHNAIHPWRALFMLSLSTALYVTSLAHWLFTDQYLAFMEMEGQSFFSIKDFDGSLLTVFVFTVVLYIVFRSTYPGIVQEFKATKRKGRYYGVFLLYLFPSFLAFLITQGHFLGYSFLVS